MPATEQAIELTKLAALAADEKKATDLIAFDVADRLAITDVFLICSASNERQVGAVVDAIHERLLTTGAKPARREGEKDKRWVLLDYVDLVVHVQHEEDREFYSLERLWRDCPEIELPEGVGQTSARSESERGA